jgi:hypothetical protein
LETTTTSYIDEGFHGVVHDTGALVLTDTLAADAMQLTPEVENLTAQTKLGAAR